MVIWLVVGLTLVLAAGWAGWLGDRSRVDAPLLLPAVLTPALSAGGLSLVMLGLGLLRVPLTPRTITAVYALAMLPGWWLALRGRVWRRSLHWKRLGAIRGAMLVVLAGIAAAVIFNAVQWPFYRADTLGIYVPFAREIATTHALAPINAQRNLYELYPQLMSMNYAYVFMAAGWENPYPARLIAALLSLGCLPAVFVLGRAIYGNVAAWAAVLLLALVPDFGSWASSGYVDLPMAFFYTLAALFAWALAHGGSTTDAALAGAAIGLAAWTKNAALLGGILFFIYVSYHLIRGQITVKQWLLALGSAAIIAAPWYLRNLILSGQINPDTVWTEDARQTWREVLVLVTLPQNYGLPGALMLLSTVWGGWQIAAGDTRPQSLLLLGWTAPYYITWLLFASYDPRFMLLVLPLLAVLAGGMVARVSAAIPHRRRLTVVVMILVGVLAVPIMWKSVEYKRALLTQPHMSHETKLDVVLSQK